MKVSNLKSIRPRVINSKRFHDKPEPPRDSLDDKAMAYWLSKSKSYDKELKPIIKTAEIKVNR